MARDNSRAAAVNRRIELGVRIRSRFAAARESRDLSRAGSNAGSDLLPIGRGRVLAQVWMRGREERDCGDWSPSNSEADLRSFIRSSARSLRARICRALRARERQMRARTRRYA